MTTQISPRLAAVLEAIYPRAERSAGTSYASSRQRPKRDPIAYRAALDVLG